MTTSNTHRFELNNVSYTTDAETVAVLRSIIPAAKKSADTSALQAVIELGLKSGRITSVNE